MAGQEGGNGYSPEHRVRNAIEKTYDHYPELQKLENIKASELSEGEKESLVLGMQIANSPKSGEDN